MKKLKNDLARARYLSLVFLLVSLLPLAVTPVLPLVDSYAHAIRYLMLSGQSENEAISANYEPAWALLPNVGGDLLGALLMHVVEPIVAMKIMGAFMMLAPVVGLYLLSWGLHGRITTPALLFGPIIAVSYITIWGFTNFLIGLGAALAATGLWVKLSDQPKLQLISSLALGPLILLMHGLAFLFWGLILAGLELGRILSTSKSGQSILRQCFWPLIRLLSLAVLPVFIWSLMRTGGAEAGLLSGTIDSLVGHAQSGNLWDRLWQEGLDRVLVILRVVETGWPIIDILLGLLLWSTLVAGFWFGTLKLHPWLGPVVWIFLALTIVMPPSLFGVGYVADRVPLVLLCVLGAGLQIPTVTTGQGRQITTMLFGFMLITDVVLTSVAWFRQGQTYREFISEIATVEVEGTAFPFYVDKSGERGGADAIACKPLAPLLTLLEVAAVPTFANPTQQPLRLAGALASNETQRRSTMDVEAESIDGLLSDGFDFVLVCVGQGQLMASERVVVTSGSGWRLVR